MDFTLYSAYNAYKKNKKNYKYEISVPKRRKVNNKKIDEFFERYINGEDLKKKEMIYLFQTIISNAEYDLEMEKKADKLYTKILNLDRKYSFAECVFFTQYSTFIWIKKQKYDSNGKIKEEYKDLKMPRLFFAKGILFRVKNAGAYQSRNKVVFNGINNCSFEQHLHVLYHELTHYKQWYELNNSFVTQSAINYFKCIILAAKKGEYNRNYDFKEAEVEAETEGFVEVIEVLKKYAMNKYEVIEKRLKEKENIIRMQALSFQSDEESNFYETYTYNVQEISNYLKKDKQLMKIYKFLSIFYSKNGILKNEEELLKSYKESKQNDKVDITIFYEFFLYLYDKGISDIKLSDDLYKEKCEIIY